MEVIPWKPFPSFIETVTLDNRRFVIAARWNTRHEFWTLDILTAQREVILGGLKVVIGVELLHRYRDSRLPSGVLIAVDITGKLERIGRENMGVDVLLMYEAA